jgi:two-component system phosphate regulon sensor histidine kinase PhoR
MKITKLNSMLVLGLVAIVGILVAQLLWTKEAYDIEEQKFSQKAHIALLEVVKKLYEGTNHELPAENPVRKVSNDYYIVNIDNDFEPEILEYYLKAEFAKANLDTDFEYAMYNCQSDEMVYGNYVSFSNNGEKKTSVYFPKHKNLVYYFAIRFPNEDSYLFSSLRFWFALSFALVVILLVYVYSIFIILQQKKYSELQRDFINNMTHEFKTPLSSILLAANYLTRQQTVASDEKLAKYAGIIVGQGNKLNSHIEKILNIAKSDGAPMALHPERIDLAKTLREIADSIRIKHENAAITIDVHSALVIEADAFHFANMVYNLLDNAIKYCDKRPEIVITATREGNMMKLEFSDNGIGVPQQKLNDIFDKFYRVPSGKSNEVNGFGLGLYYVKKICTLQHWKIKAANNDSGGLTITIAMPL